MSDTETLLDWTRGSAGIVYQHCTSCDALWYARRDFCPECGYTNPNSAQASGQGVVYATAMVTRAPTEALRAYAPYLIVLVDCAEGFRVMAHADAGVNIGDPVRARFIDFGGRTIPHFEKEAT